MSGTGEASEHVDTADTDADVIDAGGEQGGADTGDAGGNKPSEAEARARRMGWHPKDEYEASGRDPSKWVDAEEFNRRGEEQLPVLKERYRKLERQYEGLEGKLNEGNKLLQDLVKSQDARTKREVEKAITSLKAQRREAAQTGDADRVEELSGEIAEQEASLKAAPEVRTEHKDDKPEIPPEVTAWVEANPWFNTNRVMNAAATAHFGELMKDKTLNDTQRLAKVRAEMVRRFPEAFTNANRQRNQTVEGGGNGGRRTNEKGWEAIPAEDRAIGERLIKQGAVKDRAAYAKDYFGLSAA